jgi:hypothetical protein
VISNKKFERIFSYYSLIYCFSVPTNFSKFWATFTMSSQLIVYWSKIDAHVFYISLRIYITIIKKAAVVKWSIKSVILKYLYSILLTLITYVLSDIFSDHYNELKIYASCVFKARLIFILSIIVILTEDETQ